MKRKRGSSAGKAGELFGGGMVAGGTAGALRGSYGWRRSRAGAKPPQAAKRPGCAGRAGREKCSGREGAGGRWRGFWRAGVRGRRSRAGAEPRRAGAEPPQAAKRPGCAGWAGREKPRRGSAGWGQTSIWELRRARKSVSQRSWPLGAAPQPSARRKVPSVKVM